MSGDTLNIIIDAVIAAALCAGVVVLIQAGRRLMLSPVPRADGVELITLLAVSGDVPQLEQTVAALLYRERPIFIADCGLTPEARKTAELLERGNGSVLLVLPSEIPKILGDTAWTETEA